MRRPRPAPYRVLLAAGTAVVLGAGVSPVASAAVLGEAEDPAGDAAAPEPERDLTGAGFGYDPATGRMAAAIRLRGPSAGAPATIVAYAGTRTPTGCDRGPTIGFASDTDRSDASWLRTRADGSVESKGRLDKSGPGSAVQRFDVSSSLLRNLKADCALVSTIAVGDGTTIYDQLSFDLVGQPALSVRLTGLPRTVRASSRRHALRIAVSNPGHAPTGRVRVRLGAVRGMTAARRTVSLPAIAPGTTRTTTLRIRFGRRARASTEVPVTAKAGRLSAKAERAVRVRQPSRKPSAGGGPPGGTPSTCVQYFPDFSGDSGGSLGLVPCVR